MPVQTITPQLRSDTDWGTRELVFRDDQGHTIYAGMPVSTANASNQPK